MSGNLTFQRYHPEEILTDERLNDQSDALFDAAVNRLADMVLAGRRGLRTAVNISPSSTIQMAVNIPAFDAYDSLGRHCALSSPVSGFDCSQDYLGNATRPSSGHRYCSAFVFFDWLDTSSVTVGGETYYKQRTETYEIRLYRGQAVSDDETPVPPMNPGGGAIRLFTVECSEGQTTLAASDVKDTGSHQDVIGSALLTTGGRIITSPTGRLGGKLVESEHGVTQFAGYVSRIGDDSFLTNYVPPFLHDKAAATAYLNHGLTGPQVMIHKRINMNGVGTYGANYVDLSDLVSTGLGVENTGVLWTFHRQGGAENYTGQSGILAIGETTWASAMQGRWIRWIALSGLGDSIFGGSI